MPRRSRPLTPAQRSAKIEGDRRRRREHKALVEAQTNEINLLTEENERLKNYMVPDLQNTLLQQQQQIRQLQQQIRQLQQHQNNLEVQEGQEGLGFLQNKIRELQGLVVTQSDEIARLTAMVPYLQDTVHQQREMIRKLQHQKNLEEEETRKLADSFLDIDEFPSPNEEAANNEFIAGGASSSQNERVFGGFEKPSPREEAERQRKGKATQKFRN